METPGARATHKAAVRKALHDAAQRMFEERGYERTTVRDIAAAAGVTERTFFRYFPSKEDLALGELLDLVPHMQALVAARPADESPYTAALHAGLDLLGDRALGIMLSGPPHRFAQPTRLSRPVLVLFEEGLAQALAERLARQDPESATALRAAVLSRAAVGAVRSALTAYAALPTEDRTPASARELLHTAFSHLKE